MDKSGRGYITGWAARHRGQEGIPPQYADYCFAGEGPFALSRAEKELLKDPAERAWRRLPAEEELEEE